MLKRFKRWRAYVAARDEMRSLSRRELKDMGITAGEINLLARDHIDALYPK